MSRNRLKIEASSLKLEFTGDRDNIERGYEMTRELLISCFLEQLSEQAAQPVMIEETSRPDIQRDQTKLMHSYNHPARQDGKHWSPPEDPDEKIHLSLVLSSDMYNKVCVLDRAEFDRSMLNSVFKFEGLGRLYVRNNQKGSFERHFTIGKVLWRELTDKGRKAVRKG